GNGGRLSYVSQYAEPYTSHWVHPTCLMFSHTLKITHYRRTTYDLRYSSRTHRSRETSTARSPHALTEGWRSKFRNFRRRYRCRNCTAHADHTVESGDTLSDIAAKHDGVTVSSLMEANGLSSHIIYPGQNLSFSGDSSSSSDSSSTTTSTSSSSSTHTVASGDTLGSIAAQHGV